MNRVGTYASQSKIRLTIIGNEPAVEPGEHDVRYDLVGTKRLYSTARRVERVLIATLANFKTESSRITWIVRPL